VSSIIRLGTQYGGGKTHSLIALVHAVRGMKGVANVLDFVDPAILPSGPVRVAALDGENADPANGLPLELGLLAHSLWDEMAYRLAGRHGYERVRQSDERHIAPGADTIRELFGGQPTLILLDEISVYLRKVERAFPDASKQFAAFVRPTSSVRGCLNPSIWMPHRQPSPPTARSGTPTKKHCPPMQQARRSASNSPAATVSKEKTRFQFDRGGKRFPGARTVAQACLCRNGPRAEGG